MKKNTNGSRLLTALTATLLLAPAFEAPLAAQDDPAGETNTITRRLKVVVGDDEVENTDVFVLGDDGEAPRVFSLNLGRRAYLGVGLLDITPELREHFGVPSDSGVLISKVEEDSPAAAAGLHAGDVLTAIDGESVARSGDVVRRLGRLEDNTTVGLEIWRGGKMIDLAATLELRERSQIDIARMLHRGVPLPDIPHFEPGDIPQRIIEIKTERLDEALSQLRERLDSPEWKARIQEMDSRRHGLEERILELEERLREMEKRLDEADG